MIFPSSRRARWLAGGIATAAAAGGAFAFIPAASGTQSAVQSAIASDASQATAVEAAFTRAVQADREVTSPPSASPYGIAANAAATAGHAALPAPAAVRDAQLRDGKAALARYFTPALAAREERGLVNAVNAEADPRFRNLGSGASKVVFDQVAVSGDSATLRAEVTVWSKFQQQQANGSWATADPVNVMIYTVGMIRNSSGQWLVSYMVGDFAPGQGP